MNEILKFIGVLTIGTITLVFGGWLDSFFGINVIQWVFGYWCGMFVFSVYRDN